MSIEFSIMYCKDDMNEIIYNFIQENDLDFEKILKYARETNSKAVIEKMVILAR